MSTPRICPNLSTLAPGRAFAADAPMKVASAPAWAMSGDSNGPLRGQCGCQWRTPRYLTEADQRTLPKVDHHARDRPGNRGHLRLAQSQYTRPPEMGSASRGQCGSAIVLSASGGTAACKAAAWIAHHLAPC